MSILDKYSVSTMINSNTDYVTQNIHIRNEQYACKTKCRLLEYVFEKIFKEEWYGNITVAYMYDTIICNNNRIFKTDKMYVKYMSAYNKILERERDIIMSEDAEDYCSVMHLIEKNLIKYLNDEEVIRKVYEIMCTGTRININRVLDDIIVCSFLTETECDEIIVSNITKINKKNFDKYDKKIISALKRSVYKYKEIEYILCHYCVKGITNYFCDEKIVQKMDEMISMNMLDGVHIKGNKYVMSCVCDIIKLCIEDRTKYWDVKTCMDNISKIPQQLRGEYYYILKSKLYRKYVEHTNNIVVFTNNTQNVVMQCVSKKRNIKLIPHNTMLMSIKFAKDVIMQIVGIEKEIELYRDIIVKKKKYISLYGKVNNVRINVSE